MIQAQVVCRCRDRRSRGTLRRQARAEVVLVALPPGPVLHCLPRLRRRVHDPVAAIDRWLLGAARAVLLLAYRPEMRQGLVPLLGRGERRYVELASAQFACSDVGRTREEIVR